MKEIKIFEIGTVFFKDKEEIHVAWNEKKEIKELTLEKFVAEKLSPEEHRNFLIEISESPRRRDSQGSSEETFPPQIFTPWSIYPFISRDVAVWIPEGESSETLKKILKENGTSLLVKDPYLFDSFTKPASTTGGDGKTSYAFRLVFQSYEKTLTDDEVNEIMNKINEKISENPNWQVR
jgi:phenylalanyl-tRNA synthetase beta chain